MSASPESLHLLAHRAGFRARDASDWWGSPVETALAALSATRHPPVHRAEGEAALDALERWRRAGQVRPVSADTVALSLAARAAANLGRGSPKLLADAVHASARMASRSPDVVPELHLALVCWALDDLASNREASPWDTIRERLEVGSVYGLDAALRNYCRRIAEHRFQPGELVRELIAQTPQSPSATDAAVVLWLLEVAIDRCARSLNGDEPGLQAMIERRAAIAERLSIELDDAAFSEPSAHDFDAETHGPTYLSPMESLLLDIALAPGEPEASWLTYPQAEALLGQEAREERRRRKTERRRLAASMALVALLFGGVVGLSIRQAGIGTSIAVSWAVAGTLAVLTIACAIGRSAMRHRRLVDGLGATAATATLCATFNAVNNMLSTPLAPEGATLIVGSMLPVIAGVAWALVSDDTSASG